MLLHDFPYARPAARPPDYGFGREHVIVRAQSRKISFDEHVAPFSIKATLRGEEHYRVDGQVMTVAPDRFLMLSGDQPYASHIDSEENVDSLCVFFADNAVQDAWETASYNDFELLDRASERRRAPAPRPQIDAYDPALTARLWRLARLSANGAESALALDETCAALLQCLARRKQVSVKDPDRRRAAIARRETFLRLQTVRDYMHENFERSLRLGDLAALGGLSPHHFLRRFAEAFGASPHAYLVALRMAAAQHLLAVTALPVSQIALAVGYEDFSAFSRRFRLHFGCPPTVYRALAQ